MALIPPEEAYFLPRRSVTRLAAIICLVLAVIFYAWHIAHSPWTWTLWMLLGLLLWCVSESHPKVP